MEISKRQKNKGDKTNLTLGFQGQDYLEIHEKFIREIGFEEGIE